jgi:predicted DNA-binding protein (UPF0251 family)
MKTNKTSTTNPTLIHGAPTHSLPGVSAQQQPEVQFQAAGNPADSYTATSAANTGKSPCTPCPQRAFCKSPCAALKALLPRSDHGRIYHTQRHKCSEGLKEMWQQMRAVRLLLEHRHAMRGRMRQVVDLTHNKGLTQDEIAARLRIERRTVGRYLARAREFAARRARGA